MRHSGRYLGEVLSGFGLCRDTNAVCRSQSAQGGRLAVKLGLYFAHSYVSRSMLNKRSLMRDIAGRRQGSDVAARDQGGWRCRQGAPQIWDVESMAAGCTLPIEKAAWRE